MVMAIRPFLVVPRTSASSALPRLLKEITSPSLTSWDGFLASCQLTRTFCPLISSAMRERETPKPAAATASRRRAETVAEMTLTRCSFYLSSIRGISFTSTVAAPICVRLDRIKGTMVLSTTIWAPSSVKTMSPSRSRLQPIPVKAPRTSR